MSAAPCCICCQIAGQKDGDLISELLGEEGYVRRIPIESQNFAIIPSLGPIVPGHTLLCPKLHIRSYSKLMPSSERGARVQETNDLLVEMNRITARLTNVLHSLYAAPVHRFEHGSAPVSSRIICTVDHAHLHFLPTHVDILPILLADPIWERAKPGIEHLAAYVGDREYLYYESPDGVAFIASKEDAYESQHMRQVFARALGTAANWNWRTDPRPDLADKMHKSMAQVAASY